MVTVLSNSEQSVDMPPRGGDFEGEVSQAACIYDVLRGPRRLDPAIIERCPPLGTVRMRPVLEGRSGVLRSSDPPVARHDLIDPRERVRFRVACRRQRPRLRSVRPIQSDESARGRRRRFSFCHDPARPSRVQSPRTSRPDLSGKSQTPPNPTSPVSYAPQSPRMFTRGCLLVPSVPFPRG